MNVEITWEEDIVQEDGLPGMELSEEWALGLPRKSKGPENMTWKVKREDILLRQNTACSADSTFPPAQLMILPSLQVRM